MWTWGQRRASTDRASEKGTYAVKENEGKKMKGKTWEGHEKDRKERKGIVKERKGRITSVVSLKVCAYKDSLSPKAAWFASPFPEPVMESSTEILMLSVPAFGGSCGFAQSKPSVVTYGALITACGKGDKPEKALRLLKELGEQGDVSVPAVSAAISACERGQLWQDAAELGVLAHGS
eukprot:Skav201337  [mRNA]  locus=scaffold1389:249713:253586:+ [translate_table: standard]